MSRDDHFTTINEMLNFYPRAAECAFVHAVIEIEAATIKARELRTDIEDLVVSNGPTNGQYIARCVIEDAMRKVQRHLIDSTVENFGGGE